MPNELLFAIIAILLLALFWTNRKSVKVYEGVARLKCMGNSSGERQLVSVFTDDGSWVVEVPAKLTKIEGLEKVRVTVTRSFGEAPEVDIVWLGQSCVEGPSQVYVC